MTGSPGLSLRARPSRRDRGQSLVELAIVTPLLLLLFMGTVDVGRIIFAYIALEDAVQEGAIFRSHNPKALLTGTTVQCAATNGCIQDRVRTSSDHPEVTGASLSLVNPLTGNTCDAASVSVTGTYNLQIITPLASQIFGNGFPLSATFTGTNLKGTCS